MAYQQHIPFLSIFIPLIFAIFIPLFKNRKAAKLITLSSIIVEFILSAILITYLNNYEQGFFTYQLGHYPAPWGNELRAGLFEAIIALTFGIIMFLSILGGSKGIEHDIKERKQPFYYLMLNLLLASLLALVYTNDIFTAYVFLEINAVAACAIVIAKESGDTIKATIKYFIMGVLGSGLYLLAVAILYSITGHLLMSNMRDAILNLPTGYEIPMIVAMVLIVVGLAVKSALFPFHTWLPDAHGSATSSASAILSGLVLKGYIILLIKIICRVYGIETIERLNILPIILILGLLGMILGSVYALVQKDLKKMIAYSSVAQIGYIYLGIGLGTSAGLLASGFHIIVHAATKSMLFIASGNFIEITGSKKIEDLNGVAHTDPKSGLSFLIGSLSMIGIPLFGGFVSKLLFIDSALDSNLSIIILIGLAISTMLNGMYYIPVLLRIYSKKDMIKHNLEFKSSDVVKYSLNRLIFINVILGIFSKPILNAILEGIKNLG
ncbi:proton-conducting transporter membrane subunit [Tissierella sp. Yu-01]|uniref:complex I subunit 5 family protein n=1 Tax=Tissierella sp. Yu-01 TaxID=3035694 RepID=UPI00240E36DF|nr:proton-conducting transporter membrane subunit [Tissierella sp. Yu-01]WFA08474.1 proton-conducting transporter membrane subunit [Tissierella sp. Yu-01]